MLFRAGVQYGKVRDGNVPPPQPRKLTIARLRTEKEPNIQLIISITMSEKFPFVLFKTFVLGILYIDW